MIIETFSNSMGIFTANINKLAERKESTISDFTAKYNNAVLPEKIKIAEENYTRSADRWRTMTAEHVNSIIDNCKEYFRIRVQMFDIALCAELEQVLSRPDLNETEIEIIRQRVFGSYWACKRFADFQNRVQESTSEALVHAENTKTAKPDIERYYKILEELRSYLLDIVYHYNGASTITSDVDSQRALISYGHFDKTITDCVNSLNYCPVFFVEAMFERENLTEEEQTWLDENMGKLKATKLDIFVRNNPQYEDVIMRSSLREKLIADKRQDWIYSLCASREITDELLSGSIIFGLTEEDKKYLSVRNINIANMI